MMTEPVRLISKRHLAELEASRRRLQWAVAALACLTVALMVNAAPRPRGLELPNAARRAEASTPVVAPEQRPALPPAEDPLYDQFLRKYAPLRGNADLRRYLVAQVVEAATLHQVDPDLLFALIAAESSFDSGAISPKGARGLGQMQFATARAVAPGTVRQPEDLHDVPKSLYATALHLRQLLGEGKGDLPWALRVYYTGTWDRVRSGRDDDRYVARVSTDYAYLKAKRAYHDLTARAASRTTPGAPGN